MPYLVAFFRPNANRNTSIFSIYKNYTHYRLKNRRWANCGLNKRTLLPLKLFSILRTSFLVSQGASFLNNSTDTVLICKCPSQSRSSSLRPFSRGDSAGEGIHDLANADGEEGTCCDERGA